ncbi:MAG: PKD domain-containing protein [Thermoanaerobaculia bacterium]
MRRSSLPFLLALLVCSATASATTIVLPTDEQLIAKSPFIAEGTVESTTVAERDGAIWTESTLKVARRFKGATAETITVRELGGQLGERVTKIYGSADLRKGERVLLFLEASPRGDYRVIDLFAGKLTAAETQGGERLWFRDDTAQHATLLDANFQPLQPKNIQRRAELFEAFVVDRVAGRPGTRNYGIENPLLAQAKRDRVSSDFELIAEPTIYRWSRFDSNQGAAWYSSGTQSGYPSGGVSALQTAMSSWTGYSSARILYSYAGSRSGTPGGLSTPNGVNEVLFGDPLNEIAGTWNNATGGVVGTGGFNGINQGDTWNAPFNADAVHTAGAKATMEIVEGNLVIQDGVSISNGISANVLAEIVAHEFGHTLGFGHSSSGTALMFASVTGLGPGLRDDDRLAARWLYPTGTVEPPPPGEDAPAAPSNLKANASGTSVELTWTDNSSNESGFRIYIDGGNGGSVGANTTSARVNGFSNGIHSAYVVAYNGGGSSTPSNTATFTIGTPPAAAFSVTPGSGTAGLTTFFFYDQSTGVVSSREWNFGDGITSTDPVATHIYASSGVYTVTLTVSGLGTQSSTTKTINVSGELAASFVFSPASPKPGQAVQFTDQSTGAPSGWSWDFGDGTSSNEQNPSKTYAAQGTYVVTLTAQRAGVSSTTTRTIVVSNDVPTTPTVVAAFDASPSFPEPGANVTFTDRSAGNPTSWNWTFGDGSTSTAQNPMHSYASPGTYTVTLTAANATTSAIASRIVTVSSNDAYRTLVSVAARTPGSGGTSWRTELSLFNAGSAGATVTLVFLPSTLGTIATHTLYLPPAQSQTFENVLTEVFGLQSGAGALAIDASTAGGSADLRVTSRTFTGSEKGTYGQSVPDVKNTALTAQLYLTGMHANDSFRTNIGLVNRATEDVAAMLTLYNENGGVIGSETFGLSASSFVQMPLAAVFPQIEEAPYGVLSLRVGAAKPGAVSVYASVVDNLTQDPVFIQAIDAPTGGKRTIPVVGRAEGANGTFWRSDVAFFNPLPSRMVLNVLYRGEAQAVVLESNQTKVLADVVAQFGKTSGSGTLDVTWSTATGPVITSRTYTSVATGGTFGQSIDPIASFSDEQFVPGLRNDASYRSNVGFVNGGSSATNIVATLIAPDGSELGRANVPLAAGASTQSSIAVLFPGVVAPDGFTLRARGTKIFAYGSMVDNASGDPVFFAGY